MSVGGLQLVKLTINPLWEASFFFTMAMLALSGSYRYRLRRLQPFWCAIIICSFIVCISQVCESTPVLSPPKTRVFGPGIHAKRSALPVNYFYIQAVDSAGKNFTGVSEDSFLIAIKDPATERVRVRTERFYLGRGLLLYQYRVYSDYESLTISVTYDGRHVAKSPYTVRNVLHEDCACPLRSAKEWLQDFQCPKSDTQIRSDLKPFVKGGVNVTGLYERGGELFSRNSFIHYSVVDNKLYAQKFGSITGFKFLSDMILLSIVNKVRLPDMELLVNLGDWPLNVVARQEPFPVFSWCGSDATRDIIWPTWDLMKSTIMGMDRVTLSMLTAQRTRGIPWQDRLTKAYFRGRDSNQARLDLVRLHRNNSELFDVGITNWFFFDYDEAVYGPKANHVSFHDFFQYKYQLNLDGTVAAYRLPYLLAGGSLVLKQDSDYYEHFYRHLQPWVHYVPLERDVSDVVERLEWALENDDQAQEMADHAFQFVLDHLLPEHIYCYMVSLLKEYARLQVGLPQIHAGMEPVEPEKPHDCTQICQRLQSRLQKKKKSAKDEL